MSCTTLNIPGQSWLCLQPASALFAASLASGASDRHVTTAKKLVCTDKTDTCGDEPFLIFDQNSKIPSRIFPSQQETVERERVLDQGEGHAHAHYTGTPTHYNTNQTYHTLRGV